MEKTKKFALITGGSHGIGKCIAEQLAARGFGILLVALPGPELTETARALASKFGVPVHYKGVDLCDEHAEQFVFDWFKTLDCDLDILVNNVGVGYVDRFLDQPLEYWEKVTKLNSLVMMRLTYLFLPSLLKRESAYILNMGSVASEFPIPYKVVYAASKHFVSSFSYALRIELKDYSNVSVTCILPSGVLTSKKIEDRVKTFGGLARYSLMRPEKVAKVSVRAMFKGRRRVHPGRINKFFYWLTTIMGFNLTMQILTSGVRRNLQVD